MGKSVFIENKFVKVKKLIFGRTEDNEFITMFLDKDDKIVQTMDAREIFVGETYELDFGYELPILSQELVLKD